MKKNLLKLVLFLFISISLFSCADSKDIMIDNKPVYVEPYGWADYETVKNDSVQYRVSVGNVVWSVLLSETIVAPIILTGWYLYEPVKKK